MIIFETQTLIRFTLQTTVFKIHPCRTSEAQRMASQ